MRRVNYKKTLATFNIILYFVLCWVICRWTTPGYLLTGTNRLYFEHGITGRYYSMGAYLVLYISALLYFLIVMMREDQMCVAIRHLDREEIWKMKMFYMVIYIFQFTVIQFAVDIILTFCVYPFSEVIDSQILTYLMMFFPNVFFFYIFFAGIFLMCHVFLATKKALLVTISMSILIYLAIAGEIVPAWNPFFFLSMLGIQIQNGINEADVILSYLNILSLDIIAVFMGLKRYYNKDSIF